MLIYIAMVVDLPAWGLKAVDKIWRGVYWQGGKEAKGEHCQVAWGKECRPLELGGLGISSLKELGWALRMWWLWLQKTDPTRPWSTLPMQIPHKIQAFFSIVMQCEVRDGASTLFWSNKWLHGQCVDDIAPWLFAAIPKR
jgi:hypothetical protein